MKKWKKIVGILLVILFAYGYAHISKTPPHFDVETFCMVILMIAYVVGFFKFLCKLFSR
jgi:hypothetical protein